MNDTIFTLDARDHCMLEVMTDYFKLDHDSVHREINFMFQDLIGILKSKSINYQELRSCLTPSTSKKEVILVFDSLQIDNSWYGDEVFRKILPLLDKRTSHSFLCGDYLELKLGQEMLHDELISSIKLRNPSSYRHSSQYYFVYINNVSENLLEQIDRGLKPFKPYTGYIDATFSCFMKFYASMILCNTFIKHKDIVICGHEDDRDNSENVNMSGYAFEDNHYKCVSLQESLVGVFLSYKIERPVNKGFERDTEFSINSIARNVLAIDNFDVEIDQNKLKYLKREKTGSMRKSELIHFDQKELETLIRKKIADNYLYNLCYLKEHDISKFNIVLEKKVSSGDPIRLMVALEYMPEHRKLRLITMF